MRLLLKHGVEVNTLGGRYENALQAAEEGREEAVKLYMQKWRDATASGPDWQYLLFEDEVKAEAYDREGSVVRSLESALKVK